MWSIILVRGYKITRMYIHILVGKMHIAMHTTIRKVKDYMYAVDKYVKD